MKSLIDEIPFASDPVTYASRWDFLKTFVAPVIQNLKEVTLESVASSYSGEDLLEENPSSITTTKHAITIKRAKMDNWMKSTDARQDIMGANLREILDLLKKP